MLERVQISSNGSTAIHYQILNEDGSIQAHGAIPFDEWESLRLNMIKSIKENPWKSGRKSNNPIASKMIDFLTILAVFSLD
jgi:hypothetical protein